MRIIRSALLILPLLLAAPVCAAQVQADERRSDVLNAPHDEAMEAAIARARETLPVFHEYLGPSAAGEVNALLKARFEFGDEIEHMWISEVSFKGGVYHGRLASTPIAKTDLAPGDPVVIGRDEVTDWLVFVDEVMVGGFTVVELRNRMDPAQRKEFDAAQDYRVPDEAVLAPPR